MKRTELAEKAIRSYSESTKAWQRFLHESARTFGPDACSELRSQLLDQLTKSPTAIGNPEASIILGCTLNIPWDVKRTDRDKLLDRFCDAWLDSRSTPPRLDIVILLLEGYGRGLRSAVSNKHLITLVTNEAMVSDPRICDLVIAIAIQNGLSEGDLLR